MILHTFIINTKHAIMVPNDIFLFGNRTIFTRISEQADWEMDRQMEFLYSFQLRSKLQSKGLKMNIIKYIHPCDFCIDFIFDF